MVVRPNLICNLAFGLGVPPSPPFSVDPFDPVDSEATAPAVPLILGLDAVGTN